MEMPVAEQRKREAWIGSESVREERGLKMGGWYMIIVDVGSKSASSAMHVVRLVLIEGQVKSGMFGCDYRPVKAVMGGCNGFGTLGLGCPLVGP